VRNGRVAIPNVNRERAAGRARLYSSIWAPIEVIEEAENGEWDGREAYHSTKRT
jgi:hypothetical protein